MNSNNRLIKFCQIDSSMKDGYDVDIRDALLNKLVDLAKTKPLEFSCTIAQAFKELEDEFQNRRNHLDDAVGKVVVELVKQGYKE